MCKGAPEELIATEKGTSLNTRENLGNIMEILESENIKRAIVETSEYHLGRARLLFENVLKRHGLRVELASVSAEKILNEMSPHYKAITSQYQFPESLIKAPIPALKKRPTGAFKKTVDLHRPGR